MVRALTLLLLVSACTSSASNPPGLGERIYTTTCMTCHQVDGKGISGIYPPLAESPWVNGDEGRLVRLVLNGLRGPLVVDGVTYNNVMTPHRFLSDDQIAAVLTYVRSNFGNAADTVRAEQVAAVRAALDHKEAWTVETLRNATGIPEP